MRLWEGPDRFILPDTWTSFQHERRELLDVMQYVPKCVLFCALGRLEKLLTRMYSVVVISGDKHEFAAATLRESGAWAFRFFLVGERGERPHSSRVQHLASVDVLCPATQFVESDGGRRGRCVGVRIKGRIQVQHVRGRYEDSQ